MELLMVLHSLVAAAALTLGTPASLAGGDHGSVPRFEPGPCASSAAAEPELAHAKCGHLVVPENRARPTERTIKLPVAILPSVARPSAEAPVVHMAGGPGAEVFSDARYLVEAGINRVRDVILMTQRGTWTAQPDLTCPEIDRFNIEALGLRYNAPSTKSLHLAATKECHDRLLASEVDLNAYNSTENAADFADLRKALGIATWNVHGVSYGTDLALTYLREHPEGIRSVIIDSVVPPDVASLGWTWTSVKEGWDNLLRTCNEQAACRARYPDLDGTLERLVLQLEERPLSVTVTPPQGGEPVTVVVDGGHLIAWLVSARPPLSKIPSMLKELEEGNPEPIAKARALLADASQIGRFSHGMSYSVFCSEWVPYEPESEILAQGRRAFPEFPDSVLELAPQMPFMSDDCRIWNVNVAPARVRELPRHDVPTLVLSGGYDMRTSPQWATHVADALPNATNVVVPGVGHWAELWSPCAQSVVASFLKNPDAPDLSCVAGMREPTID